MTPRGNWKIQLLPLANVDAIGPWYVALSLAGQGRLGNRLGSTFNDKGPWPLIEKKVSKQGNIRRFRSTRVTRQLLIRFTHHRPTKKYSRSCQRNRYHTYLQRGDIFTKNLSSSINHRSTLTEASPAGIHNLT